MGDSIFEFADEFGIESPFGNWVNEDFKPSISTYTPAKIAGMTVIPNNNTIKSNLSPNVPNNVVIYQDYSEVDLKVIVHSTSSTVGSVHITLKGGETKTALNIYGTLDYEAVFKVKVPRIKAKSDEFNTKDFIFTSFLRDRFDMNSIDEKVLQVTINASGKIISMNSYNVDLNIITYKIFWNTIQKGRIEKYIPSSLLNEKEGKAKYEYYDQKNQKTEICEVQWHKVKEKKTGVKSTSIPTHSKIILDENVSEGQTQRRVKYENGDIAEYGSNNGKTFWVLYVAKNTLINLVRMPNEINLQSINVNYSFSNTQRRFTSPDVLAGFIGALAENKLKLTTTGSCFSEGSCFPSVEHVNGKSVDTLYLDDVNEQKFINAMKKFGFDKQITGRDKKKFNNAIQETNGDLHNSHLHSGYNNNFLTIFEI